ncbi:hypothetical protein ACFQE8_22550 [Salinirubellus sp. GCM10025818]
MDDRPLAQPCLARIERLLDHCDEVAEMLDVIGRTLVDERDDDVGSTVAEVLDEVEETFVDERDAEVESMVADLLEAVRSARQDTYETLDRELSKLLAADPGYGSDELTPGTKDRYIGELTDHHDRLCAVTAGLSDRIEEGDHEGALACVDEARTALRHLESATLHLKCMLRSDGTSVVPADGADGGSVVKGRITQDGTAASGLTVRAYDRDLRGHERLGEATTNADGRYRIAYGPDVFAAGERASADLLIRVYDEVGGRLAASDVRYNADASETIDLEIPPEVVVEPSEYARLRHELKAVLNGVELTDLSKEDVEFLRHELDLAGRAAYPAGGETLTTLLEAAALEERFPADTELLYGLGRQDVELRVETFATTSTEEMMICYETAVAENIVGHRENAESDITAIQRRASRSVERRDWQSRAVIFEVIDVDGDPAPGYRLSLADQLSGRSIASGTTDAEGRVTIQVTMPPGDDAMRALDATVTNQVGEAIVSKQLSVTAGSPSTVTLPRGVGDDGTAIGELDPRTIGLPEEATAALEAVSLAEIRSAGDVASLGIDLNSEVGDHVADVARLALMADLETASALATAGYDSPVSVADTPVETFVESIGDGVDPDVAREIHTTSQVQSAVLSATLAGRRAAVANGTDVPAFDIGGDA